MPSLTLSIPPSDQTAGNIALSRVCRREDLHILRPFGATKLHRRASKASVDILLRCLRGPDHPQGQGDDDEGSKQCMAPRCRRLKPRSAFVSAVTNCTRQWLSRDRRCLDCAELDRQEKREALYRTDCHGTVCGGRKKPRSAFSPNMRDASVPVCIEC